jgi:hypothetical protein
VATPAEILQARRAISALYLDDKIGDYILDLVGATRDPAAYGLAELAPLIEFGASPRATLALGACARAHALPARPQLRGPGGREGDRAGRAAPPVITTYEAEAEEVTSDDVVRAVLGASGALSLRPCGAARRAVPAAAASRRRRRATSQQVRRLELRTRRLVDSRFSGEYHSVFKGQGIEFAEVREYQPGDDVRAPSTGT